MLDGESLPPPPNERDLAAPTVNNDYDEIEKYEVRLDN